MEKAASLNQQTENITFNRLFEALENLQEPCTGFTIDSDSNFRIMNEETEVKLFNLKTELQVFLDYVDEVLERASQI